MSYTGFGRLDINMENYNIILYNMPTGIKAFTRSNPDGTYTIVLNARLSNEQQRLSFYHELMHIQNGDYDRKTDVGMLEIYAHHDI